MPCRRSAEWPERLQAELARLRKQHAERAAARTQEVLADLAQGPAPVPSPQGSPGPAAGLSEAELMRTIKVTSHPACLRSLQAQSSLQSLAQLLTWMLLEHCSESCRG